MRQQAHEWNSAVGAWVWLSDLLRVVKDELNISPSTAASPLRQGMETNDIAADIPGWVDPGGMAYCVIIDRLDTPPRISPAGWVHVDFELGTLASQRIRVNWADVLRTLTPRSEPSSSGPQSRPVEEVPLQQTPGVRSSGRPPRHDWQAFWIEVVYWVDLNGLQPEHRQDLQRHMVEFLAGQEHPPDDATIRSKLKDLYDAGLNRA
jgi:hypothetical protein